MQQPTLFAALIVFIATQQLFISGRVIDHGSFSVMVDDIDIDRVRPPQQPEPTPVPANSTSNASSEHIAATFNGSAPIFSNQSLSEFAPINDDSSASDILAAIRAANEIADPQRKPVSNATTTSRSGTRGYLSPGASIDRRPSAISIVEEDLLIVPVEGGHAIAYDINARDQYGHGYQAGIRSIVPERPAVQEALLQRDDSIRQHSTDVDVDVSNLMPGEAIVGNQMPGDVVVGTPNDAEEPSIPRRSEGRHFVQIHDGHNGDGGRVKRTPGVDDKHGNSVHEGEHKRAPIRKAADEWRCLETTVEPSGVFPEKIVCPPGLMITSFGLASFGNPHGTCVGAGDRRPGACHVDVSGALQSRCLGRTVCDLEPVEATVVAAQCPANTGPVRVIVEYRCSAWVSPPATRNSTVDRCQVLTNNGTLRCTEGQAILGFGFGFFGEIDGSCSKGIAPGLCSRNVMTDLTTQCVGRKECRLNVSTNQFGTACANSTAPMALAANYKCGSLAEAAVNGTKGLNQTYATPTTSLRFAKGNGALAQQAWMAVVVAVVGIVVLIA